MEPILGMILAFGFNFNPRGWAYCNGAILAVQDNTALFSLLGTAFGGDGRSTFGLPDLRGRVIVGMGQGPGLSSYTIGHMGGYETVTLTEAQLASHSHGSSFTGASATVKVSTQPGTNSTPGGRSPVLAASSDTNVKIYNNEDPGFSLNIGGGEVTGSITIDNTGGSQGHANIQPYTVINYCIALQGLYPSRS